jgi:sarcosine oxidase subunit gamma
MADALARHAPLDPQRLAHGGGTRVTLAPFSPATRLLFRGGPQAAEIAGASFAVQLPNTPCRANRTGGRATLWLGPDEFLLLAPEEDANEIASTMRAALAPHPHALVDVSHRNTAIQLAGPEAATVLNAGCPLDLHETSFPVDMCTRTVLAKAEIVLWRTAADEFHLEIWRSFAPYVWDFLIEARARL